MNLAFISILLMQTIKVKFCVINWLLRWAASLLLGGGMIDWLIRWAARQGWLIDCLLRWAASLLPGDGMIDWLIDSSAASLLPGRDDWLIGQVGW